MHDELFYRVAITMIPDLGPVRVKALIDYFGDATSIFKAKKKDLVHCAGIHCADQIKSWKQGSEVDEEILFLEENKIAALFLTDNNYPRRLLHCYDPPSLLYYRGNADLNQSRIISIIGTRNHSAYGKQVTETLIHHLEHENILILSGLAFGIDAIAHKAALAYHLPTVGVLGHGMDTIYPSQNKTLAKEMLLLGGLLTEFRKGTLPDKHNFPKRNRIVAGMADATVVVETAVKGGSMITARLAHEYNRDLFAVPGRLTDPCSGGCLELVRENKAMVFTGTNDLLEAMGWKDKKRDIKKQKELFAELTDDEKKVVAILAEKELTPVDDLYLKSGMSNSRMAGVILQLELRNIIKSLPGKMYSLT